LPEATSLTANTLFHRAKRPLTQWFLAVYRVNQTKSGMSSLELVRHLDVQQNSAWLILHKVMQAMRIREESRRLGPFAEGDDAYLCGHAPG
jgi:hypothetical protein